VADPGAHQVFWLHDGKLEVLAGTGTDGAAGDEAPAARKPAGDALKIDLGEPVALARHDGVVDVADAGLGAVLRLYGEQQLETLPGTWSVPQAVASSDGGPLYAVFGPTAGGDRPAEVVAWSAGNGGPPEPVARADRIAGPPHDATDADITGVGTGIDGKLDVWIDDAGLYAVETGGAAQRLVDATGDERYEVVDLAVSEVGDVAVAEPGARRITVFRPDGGTRRRIDLPFPPRAVTFDGDGSVVVLRDGDPRGVFVYRLGADGAIEPIGPGAARTRARDRMSTATTTTTTHR
jgi:hypothetical protein